MSTSETVRRPVPSWWRPSYSLVAILLVGVVAYLPAIDAPRFLDDHLHVSMIEGRFPANRGPFDLYDFVDDGDRGVLEHRGLLPWWAEPDIEIRFFRPLSSALRWAEHAVCGHSQILLHLHSLAWWIAAVLGAYTLYQRSFNRRTTLLATLMFAVAPSHAIPLTWLANREALVSLALGTFALASYTRWREERRMRDALLATVLFALAALGGEYAICLGGYVAAVELTPRALSRDRAMLQSPSRALSRDRPTPQSRSLSRKVVQRVTGLLPFVVPIVAYLYARFRLGYGSAGTGFYTDPLRDLGEFLGTAPWRFASLLGNGWLGIDTSTWGPGPPRTAYLVFVAISAVVIAISLWRASRTLDGATRASIAWLLVGSFLALLPILAVLPSTRLLSVVMLGVSPVIAVVLDHAWFPATPPTRRGLVELTGMVALLLAFGHIVQAPVNSFLAARTIRKSGRDFARRAHLIEGALARTGSTDVIFVRGYGGVFFLPFALDLHGAPPPRWTVLANTGHVLVLRPDARTLEVIASEGDSLFPQTVGDLFRGQGARLAVGDQLDAPGLHVTITEISDRGPVAARFVFERDLEDPSYLWVTDAGGSIRELQLPEPGLGMPVDP